MPDPESESITFSATVRNLSEQFKHNCYVSFRENMHYLPVFIFVITFRNYGLVQTESWSSLFYRFRRE